MQAQAPESEFLASIGNLDVVVCLKFQYSGGEWRRGELTGQLSLSHTTWNQQTPCLKQGRW